MSQKILMLAGPTASGKSALALDVADELTGKSYRPSIINADSKQVYRELRILSARPTVEEEARHPHHLYGFLPAATACSAGIWLNAACDIIRRCFANDQLPILVGGTGMYLQCLQHGIAAIPDIAADIRAKGQALLDELGTDAFAAQLLARDPQLIEQIDHRNPARLLRAWEVLEQTGRSMIDWHAETTPPLPTAAFHSFALLPTNRDWLYARINSRVPEMIEEGALEEVNALREQTLDPSLPAMRAHGVGAFSQHLDGLMTLDEAVAYTQQETRHYAKRQYTWLRGQWANADRLTPDDTPREEMVEYIVNHVTM